jgi:hypothetical protein
MVKIAWQLVLLTLFQVLQIKFRRFSNREDFAGGHAKAEHTLKLRS